MDTLPNPAALVHTGHLARHRVLAVCCLCLVLVVMAVSGLNVALPEMQRDLGLSSSALLWIVDVYALVFAALLLPAGALGDRYGRRRALLVGLTLFVGGAVIAGLSTSAAPIVAMRAVMGAGAAAIMPATLSIITTVFPPSERPRAIAVWGGFAGAGGALGPLLSGLALEAWGWNGAFLIVVPVAVAAFALVAVVVPPSHGDGAAFDPGGAVLAIVTLLALLYAIIEGPERGWTDPGVLAGFVVAVVAGVSLVRWEAAVDQPMLDPRMFRIPAFASATATITLIFFAMFGMFLLVFQYLQFVQGHSALEASLRVLPSGITLILVAPRAPALASHIGARATAVAGLAVAAAGLLLLSRSDSGTAYPWLALALVLMASGLALAMPAATSTIVTSLPPSKAGVGSAVNDLAREVGGAIGIAVSGSVLSAIYRARLADSIDGLPPTIGEAASESIAGATQVASTPGAPAGLLDVARTAFVNGVSASLLVGAAAVGLALVVVLLTPPQERNLP
jgi:EmrB/QacA subfamily drug resistance transporter